VQQTKDQLQAEAERLVEGGQYGSTDKIFEAISEVSHVESEFGEWSKAVEVASRHPQPHHGDTAESPAVENAANSPAPVVEEPAKEDTSSQRSGAAPEGQTGEVNQPQKSGEAKISEKPKDSAGENTQQVFWPAAVATRGRSRRGARGAAKRGKSRDRRHKGGRDQAKETGEAAPAVSQPEDLGWPTAKITTSPAASAQEAIAAWDAFAAPDLAKTTSKPDEMKNDSAANQSRKGSVAVSSALGVWGTDQQKKADSPPSPPTLPIPSKQNSSSSVDLPPSVQAATPVEEDGPKPDGVANSAAPPVVTSPASSASGRMKISLS
ncbi:hypothetical protein FOZ63_004901, partial [Perkinsus olseni]